MTTLVTCLLYKLEDLSSTSRFVFVVIVVVLSGCGVVVARQCVSVIPEPEGETAGWIPLGFRAHQSRQISKLEVQWKTLSQRNKV